MKTPSHRRIPTGFRPPAQGWRAAPTLGARRLSSPTPTGLRHLASRHCRNLLGVEISFSPLTQGSACRATLGWRTESFQDSPGTRTASRSDALTVAVGFSPRFPAPASRVAERRLKSAFLHLSSVAPRRGGSFSLNRGLKPTATIDSSLRDSYWYSLVYQSLSVLRISTGFRPSAQGWRAAPTLGTRRLSFPTPTGLSHFLSRHCRNPVGVEISFSHLTQGSACRATLGCRTESFQDSTIQTRPRHGTGVYLVLACRRLWTGLTF